MGEKIEMNEIEEFREIGEAGVLKESEYVPRELEKELMKYLHKKEILAVIGPRQGGKTTLLKHIYKTLNNAKFITFEDIEILNLFINDIHGFAELYVKPFSYLFIDEFQYAKEGGKNLKYLYDALNTKLIISGSSASELSIQSIKFLVGRIFVFNLFPFSFLEFLNYKDKNLYNYYIKAKSSSKEIIKRINTFYKEFVIYGGYPRVITLKDFEEKKTVLKNIYNTYFLKEIKEILQYQEDFKLRKLIEALALQVKNTVNYNELSKITGFSYNELLIALNILNKTFITLEVKPFFSNKRLEILKSPKFFFLDNGFRNFVLKNFQGIEKRTDSGALNENFIASELVKKEFEPKYWRTKSGAEVDFVIERESKAIPIEVKSTLSEKTLTKSFYSFIKKYTPAVAFVLSYEFLMDLKFKKTNIHLAPHWHITRLLGSVN